MTSKGLVDVSSHHAEADLLPLSALQHLMFCPRQCALIHLEQVWTENRLTAEGRIMHGRVHERRHETRAGVRAEFSVPLRSMKLGLSGVADVVEFRPDGPPYPVEYKRGRPKKNECDEVQLCAQGMCLEEMMNLSVPEGALFYGKERRRHVLTFTEPLRKLVQDTSAKLHELMATGVTPEAVPGNYCKRCSLLDVCMPVQSNRRRVSRYIHKQVIDELQEKMQ